MNKSKNILFICKHNRFRSKVAEAFFKKLNKNKNYAASSAGFFISSYPLDGIEVEVARKFGLKLSGKPKPISLELLRKTNIVVFVADDVPYKMFKNKNYGRDEMIWKIKDVVTHSKEEVQGIISKIEKRVIKLVESLK